MGLFKKLALANYLAFYVERVYDNPKAFGAPALMLATFAFAWQIFFDFSGYTDMARGIARLLGFNLILNFNNPYLATGLGEFWTRWHISLSTWFRDYVYIPLGGNRRGVFKTYRNLFMTFLLSGIWHGAAWTFLIWGALARLRRDGHPRIGTLRVLSRPGAASCSSRLACSFSFVSPGFFSAPNRSATPG